MPGVPRLAPGVLILLGVLTLLGDLLECLPLLPGVLPRLCVPFRWWRLTLPALLVLLALVSVLALLGVLTLLRTLDLLLGWLEGAVFVLSHLVDLELLGLVTELGAVGGLVGIADLVVFKEGGDLGDAVGIEGPVDATDMLGVVGGEGMVGAKGLVVLEVKEDMRALDDHLVFFHRKKLDSCMKS